MKQLEKTTAEDIGTVAVAAFAEMTEDDCKDWIKDSKVYKQL